MRMIPMLLVCDFCGIHVSECAKIPCGYILETHEGCNHLIIPNGEDAYRNICVECLFLSSKEQEQ